MGRTLLSLVVAVAAVVAVFVLDRRTADAQTSAPVECSFPAQVGKLVTGGLYQGATSQYSHLVFEDDAGTIRIYKGCNLAYTFGRE
jgi:hypothetical protein